MRRMIYILLCFVPIQIFGFVLEHPTLPGADSFNRKEMPECILQMGFELGKEHYVVGEPIHFKRYYVLLNDKDGSLYGESKFYIRNDKREYEGTGFFTGGFIYKRAKVKRYVDCPTYMGGIRGYYGPNHMEGNLYTYFWDIPDFQFTIKPGKYWIVGTYRADESAIKYNTRTVYPGSIAVYIDSVPDNEKPAMLLLWHKKYRVLMREYPHSIYYPAAEFNLVRLKAHEFAVKKLDKGIYDEKLADEVKDLFYDLVRRYPDFCLGENAAILKLEWSVIEDLIFTPDRRAEEEAYFEKLTKNRGNNPFLNYFHSGARLRGFKFEMKEKMEKVKAKAERGKKLIYWKMQ